MALNPASRTVIFISSSHLCFGSPIHMFNCPLGISSWMSQWHYRLDKTGTQLIVSYGLSVMGHWMNDGTTERIHEEEHLGQGQGQCIWFHAKWCGAVWEDKDGKVHWAVRRWLKSAGSSFGGMEGRQVRLPRHERERSRGGEYGQLLQEICLKRPEGDWATAVQR